MSYLTEIEIFILVANTGSLSAAARELNVSPAAIGYRLGKLEAHLGTRLFHRTTRRLALTQDGADYLLKVEPLFNAIQDASAAASGRAGAVQGTLKVTMPASFGLQHITPVMPRFLMRYPDVRLDLALNDEIVDIVEQAFDVAIRISELQDSDLVAHRIASDHRVVCASPAYLERYGEPAHPKDLLKHNCLVLSQQPYWIFNGPDGLERIRIRGNYICNNGEAIRDATYAGLGISLKATWDVAGAIKKGRLRTVLDDYPISSNTAIWAVYPSRRHAPAKVHAFIGFLKEHFSSQPYWDSLMRK